MATILIADDKGSNRQFLTTLFGYFGHRVLEAEDGAQALALARSELPDLVFTDVMMPVMDGLEMARQLRDDPALTTIPIIFYTATYPGSEFKRSAAELGVAQVISKPSEPQTILDAVARVLETAPSLLSSNPALLRISGAPQNRMSEEFIASIEDLGATVLRLNATIELGIGLTRERDPAALVKTFCRGAQDIFGAKYAACGMTGPNSGELAHLYVCGLPPDSYDMLRDAARQGTLFEWMLTEGHIDRRRALAGDLKRVGLPAQHPYIDSFLGIPIQGSDGIPGWLYLAEKFNHADFTDEDERLASTLAWQAGVAYQNAFLHSEDTRKTAELEAHAATLSVQIAERERAQQALGRSEDRFRSIVAAVSEGVLIVSLAGIVSEVNQAACAMFDCTADDLNGEDIGMISSNVPPYTQQHALELIAAAAETNGPQRFEWHCKAKNGRLFWAEVSIRVASISGQDTVIATVRDVTERKNSEDQLRQSQKMEAVGTLASGIAHDINNCLVPIISLSELMVGAFPTGSREQQCTTMIREAGRRIRDLVRRILVFSRHEEITIAPLDLASICTDSVALLRATLPASLELRSRLGSDEATVEGDAVQIQQILVNLCVNAADAIDGASGGVIELSLDRADLTEPLDALDGRIAPGPYHRLRVVDNGSGMDAETMTRIFEPFYTTKPPGKGTGLGLAMVHTMVKDHSGHLTLASRPGAGSTFEIYLPASSGAIEEC